MSNLSSYRTEEQIEADLSVLRQLLTCGSTIYTWVYAADGHLIQTNCPELLLHTIFEQTGCHAYMLNYAAQSSSPAPLVLGGLIGMMWCAAFSIKDDALAKMYVVGPVINTELSVSGLDEFIKEFHTSISFKSKLVELLRKLPIVGVSLFFQYSLMLHYCVTGEKLERSDIQYQQQDFAKTDTCRPRTKDRYQTWSAEQALLRMVREGDTNYQAALDHAGEVSNGVQASSGRPIQQAIISCSIFTSLCVRAAIEGGMTPEAAYSLGDSYIQSLMNSKTITELRVTNHEMYVDFIKRVHKCRTNPKVSQQVQSCCDYIEMHLDEPLTLQFLAKRIGYTDYYLSRKFKKQMGISVNDYIRFARIEHAKMLLTSTEEPVYAIAERLQFCSGSYFAEVFQLVSGMTPQGWRDKTRRV